MNKKSFFSIIAGVIFLLVLITVYFLYSMSPSPLSFFGPDKTTVEDQNPLRALNGNTLMFLEPTGYRVVQVFEGEAVDLFNKYGASIISFAERAGNVALLINTKGTVDVAFGEADADTMLTLVSTKAKKRTIDISPDGNMIAFDEFASEEPDFSNDNSWSIHVYDKRTGELKAIGTGHSPQFISLGSGITGILYTSAQGIAVYDTTIDKTFYTSVGQSSFEHPAMVSTNSSHILAYDNVADQYTVYEFQWAIPMSLNPVSAVPAYTGITLSDSSIYGIADGVVYKHAYSTGRATTVHVFDSLSAPTRIIPN